MTKDPRITAYALGEIGAAEREQFEQEMAESDLLQSEADAMIRLGKKLEALPKNTQRFDSATREKLIADFAHNQKARRTGRQSFIIVLSATLGIAASLALVAGLGDIDMGRFHTGSGPWANGAYYPGYLDGEYLAIVSGPNIAGVMELTIVGGLPPGIRSSATGPSATFTIFSEGHREEGEALTALEMPEGQLTGLLSLSRPPAKQDARSVTSGYENLLAGANTERAPSIGGSMAVTNLVVTVAPAATTNSLPEYGIFSAKIKDRERDVLSLIGSGRLSVPQTAVQARVLAIEADNGKEFRITGFRTKFQKATVPPRSPSER